MTRSAGELPDTLVDPVGGCIGTLRAWKDLAGWADGGWNLPPHGTESLEHITSRAAELLESLQRELAEARASVAAEREDHGLLKVAYQQLKDRLLSCEAALAAAHAAPVAAESEEEIPDWAHSNCFTLGCQAEAKGELACRPHCMFREPEPVAAEGPMVKQSVYESAVQGRQEMRAGLREWKAKAQKAEAQLADVTMALGMAQEQTERFARELHERDKAIAAEGRAEPGMRLVPMDKELEWILGRPNFACAGIFQTLRKGGHEIAKHAEEEQAASIYWMLSLYFKHGADKWRDEATKELKAIHDAAIAAAKGRAS